MDIEEIKAELCILEMNTERPIMDFINQQQETIKDLEESTHTGYIVFEYNQVSPNIKQISIPFNTEEEARDFMKTMFRGMKYKNSPELLLHYAKVQIKGWQPIK